MKKQEPTIKDVMSSLDVVHKELCGLNNRFVGIEEIVGETKEEITGIKGEITGIKGEITEMKSEMIGIKGDVTGIKGELVEMKQETASLKREMRQGFAEVSVKMDKLQEDVIEIGGAMSLFAQNVDERFVKVDEEFKETRKQLANRTSRVLVV